MAAKKDGIRTVLWLLSHAIVLCSLIGIPVDGDITLFTYEIRKYTTSNNSRNMDGFTTHYASSILACARLCSNNPNCNAFYPENHTPRNYDRKCALISEGIYKNEFSYGTGVYGYILKRISTNRETTPQLNQGVLVGLKKSPHGVAAVYDCSSAHASITTVSILYDHNTGMWPDVSTECLRDLCSQTGLSNTYLRISHNSQANKYDATVICPEGDTHHSDASCQDGTGVWFISGKLKIGCVSTTCYRISASTKKAVYNGTVSKSAIGETCQRWGSQTPRIHAQTALSFPLDGYDLAKASNYCRDPGNGGFLWCYQMTGSRWGNCNIPVC